MKNRERRGDPERKRQWLAAVERWRQSGRSVRDFCRAQGLKESTFYFWRRELTRRRQGRTQRRQATSKTPERAGVVMSAHRLSPAISARPQGEQGRLSPVRVVPRAAEENVGGLEIALPGGRTT